jgi:hypothetical protein
VRYFNCALFAPTPFLLSPHLTMRSPLTIRSILIGGSGLGRHALHWVGDGRLACHYNF